MKTTLRTTTGRRVPGFTLVELLVVLAIIGVLSAMLLPAQAKAKDKGRQAYGDQGWIRYRRHGQRANYVYTDGHVESLPWNRARRDQFPDHVVRKPLNPPPN